MYYPVRALPSPGRAVRRDSTSPSGRGGSHHDLDQRDLRDRTGLEGGEVDVELVEVEADRHVEDEAGGDRGARRRDVAWREGDEPGRRVAGESGRALLDPADRDPHAARDGFRDDALIGRVHSTVGLDELERQGRAVAGADALIGRARRLRRRAGERVGAVAEAEAVEPAAPLLEESDHGGERVERAHAEPGVVAPERMRPACVALLAAGRERDDVGAPARTAAASKRNVEREANLVEIQGHAAKPPVGNRTERARAR